MHRSAKTIFAIVVVALPVFAFALNTVITGFQVGSTKTKIDAHGVCHNVQASDGKTYFIPTNTAAEWSAFRMNKPSGVQLQQCTTTWLTIAVHSHACGIRNTDNTLWCWGANAAGQLGIGSTSAQSLTPVQVPGVWTSVATGLVRTCGVKLDGSAWCWGKNDRGQLGVGDTTNRSSPTQVVGTGTWLEVDIGTGNDTCGLKNDGTALCWGPGGYGSHGNGTVGVQSNSPTLVSGNGWTKIARGWGTSCGIKTDGSAWCWGYGYQGQLGNGTISTNSSVPVRVSGSGTWAHIDINTAHACGIKTDGSAWCWGTQAHGRLGNGLTTGNATTPIVIAGAWTDIVTGGAYSCGIKNDKTLWCWGLNEDGQLGMGDTVDRSSPTQVSPGSTWKQVRTKGDTTCGIQSDDSLWCWGDNYSGELGTGTTTSSATPVQVQDTP